MSRARRALSVTVAVVAALTSACVSTKEIGGSNKPTPTSSTIAPTAGSFGTDITYGGVTVTVSSVAAFAQSPNGVPRIEVVMRAENLSRSVRRNPDVQLLCSETTNTGDWFLGSTWEPNVVLPVNAISQGAVIIGFPLKGDNPEYPVVTCSAPQLRITMLDDDASATAQPTASTTSAASAEDVDGFAGLGPAKVVLIPIDDSVITDAIREPRGPVLPLPPRGS
jgi:hypothetical protein